MMSAKTQAGFSLLEMLVALFVVVLVTSLVSLGGNSGGRDVELDAQVKSLANTAAYALDEAQLRGVDMGLLLEPVADSGEVIYHYRWLERLPPPEGWRETSQDPDIFGAQQFPVDLELLLELEDVITPELEIESVNAEGLRTLQPQVVFYASGETTAGAIDLRQSASGDLLWRIEWDILGRFSLLRRGEPEEERGVE